MPAADDAREGTMELLANTIIRRRGCLVGRLSSSAPRVPPRATVFLGGDKRGREVRY